MNKNSRLFRKIPPWSLVCQVLKMLRLGTEFPVTFQQSDIALENSVDIAGILQPYYKPKVAEQYLAYTDQKNWITVLRHILAPHGYTIQYKETTRNKAKAIFYTIQRNGNTILTPVQITFE
jgi:hypothetical protein